MLLVSVLYTRIKQLTHCHADILGPSACLRSSTPSTLPHAFALLLSDIFCLTRQEWQGQSPWLFVSMWCVALTALCPCAFTLWMCAVHTSCWEISNSLTTSCSCDVVLFSCFQYRLLLTMDYNVDCLGFVVFGVRWASRIWTFLSAHLWRNSSVPPSFPPWIEKQRCHSMW